MGGHPSDCLKWRFLATWQEGLGTYEKPYTHKKHNVSLLGEAVYRLRSDIKSKWLQGTEVKLGIGADFGGILEGPNYGLQLTLCKRGLFGK